MRNILIKFALFTISFLIVAFCIPLSALAAECGGVTTIIIGCEGDAEDSIFHLTQLIVDIISIGGGILAVVGISITGIQWLTSGGDEQKATKAKRRFFEIIIGLAIYVTSFVLLNFFNVLPQENHSNNSTNTTPSQSTTKQNSTKPSSSQPSTNNNGKKNNTNNNNNGSTSKSSSKSKNTKKYMGVPLENYTSLKSVTADMIANRANIIMNYAQKNGWTYGDSHGMPPGSDKLISCDRLASIVLYTLGFRNQPKGGYTIGNMFPWLKRLGFKESHSLNDIKRGSIVWLRYSGGTGGGHVFIVSSWDRKTGKFIRNDAGKYWNEPQPIATNGFPYEVFDNNYNDNFKVFNLP